MSRSEIITVDQVGRAARIRFTTIEAGQRRQRIAVIPISELSELRDDIIAVLEADTPPTPTASA